MSAGTYRASDLDGQVIYAGSVAELGERTLRAGSPGSLWDVAEQPHDGPRDWTYAGYMTSGQLITPEPEPGA